MTTFESSIRQIPFPQQNVYEKLSDLNNLQKLKERYAMMKDTMPEEARKQAEKIQDLEFDQVFSVFPKEDRSPIVERARYIAATRALHELYMYERA